jgi:hypothetical protein
MAETTWGNYLYRCAGNVQAFPKTTEALEEMTEALEEMTEALEEMTSEAWPRPDTHFDDEVAGA